MRHLARSLIAAVSLACTAAAHAQPFTYQGQLRDNGQIATGAWDIQLAIFAASSGGVPLGVLTQANAVQLVDGTFTVQVDPGAGVFLGGDRWLEVRVRPAGGGAYTTLTPRQRITPAPYSLRALNEWLVPAGDGLAVDSSRQRLFLNRTQPISNAEYFGFTTPTLANAYGGMYINTASDTGRPFYGYAHDGITSSWTYADGNTQQWRLFHSGGDRISVVSTGNVGIGTNSPAAKLDVAGAARASDFVYNGAKVRHISLPPSAFAPRTSDPAIVESATGATYYEASVGAGTFTAPVQAPDGAMITSVTVWLVDNSASVNMSATFSRREYNFPIYTLLTSVASAGASSSAQQLTMAPSVVVDNQNSAYTLTVSCSDWQGTGTAILGARITYTVTAPD